MSEQKNGGAEGSALKPSQRPPRTFARRHHHVGPSASHRVMSRTASLCEGAQTSRINESSWRGCRAQWQRGASTALTGMRTGDKASPERTHPKIHTHPPRDERIEGMKRGDNTPSAPVDLWPPPDGQRQDSIDTHKAISTY